MLLQCSRLKGAGAAHSVPGSQPSWTLESSVFVSGNILMFANLRRKVALHSKLQSLRHVNWTFSFSCVFLLGLPRWRLVVRNLAANAGATSDWGSILVRKLP